ncbi:MAG: acyl-CoA thioesterase [Saccharospirillaceae bacterium]|nr:acyl-CoA thioesterase [Saccharospirillaceae bacterium]
MNQALYNKEFEVRWADCDANNHMRHSAYADMAAHARIGYLTEIGIGPEWLSENNAGPVLFKETTEYFREVKMNEVLSITVEAGEPTGSDKTVTLVNNIYKESGELAARVSVLFAWMDIIARKVIVVPEKVRQADAFRNPDETAQP